MLGDIMTTRKSPLAVWIPYFYGLQALLRHGFWPISVRIYPRTDDQGKQFLDIDVFRFDASHEREISRGTRIAHIEVEL